MKYKKFIVIFMFIIICLSSCTKSDEVVVYTAVDQLVSEEVFLDFEKETGISVKAVYDLESNKTTGLVNRIIAEKSHPVCDVFWNNEFTQTIKLQNEGLLARYKPNNADDIPDKYKDKDGCWTAFGGRARVLLVNATYMDRDDFPSSFFDLLNDKYDSERIALAYPMFGTTKTHAAAIYAYLGEEKAREIYRKIAESGIQIVDGNSLTRDMVCDGRVDFAYTDTDDAKAILDESFSSVFMIYPDQEEDEMGTLICPSTVAMIKGSENDENAKVFIDYLLRKETEKKLIDEGFFDLSIREEESGIKGMDVSLYEIYEKLEVSTRDMQEFFGVR